MVPNFPGCRYKVSMTGDSADPRQIAKETAPARPSSITQDIAEMTSSRNKRYTFVVDLC